MARCRENKPDGTPCERIVPASQDYCYSHDPGRAAERKRNASRGGRSKGTGELSDLKRQLKDLAADVLKDDVDKGRASVANQILNTVIRAIEQERKQRELEEMAERLDALEEVLKTRRGA